MSQTLILCEAMNLARGCNAKQFRHRFGSDPVAWRSALLSLGMGKTVAFDFDGNTFFVRPFDFQRIGHTAGDLAADAVWEYEVDFSPQPALPPQPVLTHEDPAEKVAVFKIWTAIAIPATVSLVAHNRDHADELFQRFFPKLKRELLHDAAQMAAHLEHEGTLRMDDLDEYQITEEIVSDVDDYQRLF